MRGRRPGQRDHHRAVELNHLEIVRKAFAAIAEGDAAAMLEHYTDDVVFELPYADPPAVVEGRADALTRMSAAFSIYRFTLTITDVHELLDPDGLILEYTSAGQRLDSGAPYANTYIGVYRFRDGRIARVREFYNPTAT